MSRPVPDDAKREAIRLRVEEQLGIKAIRARTGLSIGTLSPLLAAYPLDAELVAARTKAALVASNAARRYDPPASALAETVAELALGRESKSALAVHAVICRLARLGHVAERAGGTLVHLPERGLRLHVRWMTNNDVGRPVCKTRHEATNRSYTRDECDGVVGFDGHTDCAFVFPIGVCAGRQQVTGRADHAEAWDLLGLAPERPTPDAMRGHPLPEGIASRLRPARAV